MAKKILSVPEKHQLKIAKQTLKYNDVGASIMGGMSKEEARSFLKSIGYTDREIKKLEESKMSMPDYKLVPPELLKTAKQMVKQAKRSGNAIVWITKDDDGVKYASRDDKYYWDDYLIDKKYNNIRGIIYKSDKLGENKMSKNNKKKNLNEGTVMLSSLVPVATYNNLKLINTKNDNFEFKGLPGQFNENGVKVIDDNGNRIIDEEKLNLTEELFTDLDKVIKTIFLKYTPASILRQIDMAITDLYYDKKINASTIKKTINSIGTLKNSLTKMASKKPE